jgi:anti-anti-sigma regulatory factor
LHGLPVIVDLSAGTFIGSTTMGAILYGHSQAESRGQSLVVVSPPGSRPSRTLKLAGMTERLRIVATLDEAKLAVRPGRPSGESPSGF